MTELNKQSPVGIDLGTTFSAVAYLDIDGRPETIRNSEGDLTTPSAVFFDHNRPIIGIEAVEAGLLEPDRLALFAKRDIGEAFYEKTIRGKHLPAEVIQALVLRKLKGDAEMKLGPITHAVITVPAFFNEPCRKATQDAGRLAGLDVLDIINEPTAAAITYGVGQGFLGTDGIAKQSETVLVYDLGGGTFDVTVMRIEAGHFHTIATAGDVYLGGVDWDQRIVDFIADAILAEHNVDPRNDPQSNQELLRKANQTKHALTQRDAVGVAFAHDGLRFRTELTQVEFATRCADLVERTLMTTGLVLDDAGITWADLTRLILVGGSTRMPMIRAELERLSGMQLDRSLSPDEAVCHGAALYAGMLLAGKEDTSGISVTNVNSHDLGVLAVDPESGKPRRQVMLPRNSTLPARKTVRFRTHSDNQANVKIHIVEGGDDRGINATTIGRCVVDDLPRGTPKGTHVDVRFDYTADGRLTVNASLPEIDRKITMTLNRVAGLSDSQIETWANRLDAGFSDAMLAELPDAADSPAEIVDVSSAETADEKQVNDLPGDPGTKPSDDAKQSQAPKPSPVPAAADACSGFSTASTSADSEKPRTPISGSPAADRNSESTTTAKKVAIDRGIVLPPGLGSHTDQVREKPAIQVEGAAPDPGVKANAADLEQLAALADGASKPKTTPTEIPNFDTTRPDVDTAPRTINIKTSNSEPPKKDPKAKKSGGLFGKRKK